MTETQGDGGVTSAQDSDEPASGSRASFAMVAGDVAEAAALGFAPGTMIATSKGLRPVETLVAGDCLATSTGGVAVLRGVRDRRIDGGSVDTWPIRVAAHAFGDNCPGRDLRIAPRSRLRLDFLGEMLVPAAALVNMSSIAQPEVERADYCELDLEDAAAVLADGLAVQVGDVEKRHPATYDQGLMVEATRLRLGARLEPLGWRLDPSPFADLHLVVDGERVAMRTSGLAASAMIPVSARHVWLMSAAATPRSVAGSTDDRLLGVPLVALSIDDGLSPRRDIAMDDPRLCVGFQELEGVRRWTAGRARLPASLWEGCVGHVFVRVDLQGSALPRWVPPEMASPSA